MNQVDAEATGMAYADIIERYLFHIRVPKWKQKVRRASRDTPIRCMYSVHLQDKERFYLRLLILYIPCVTCNADLRIVYGREYCTFQVACKAWELTGSDNEWEKCLGLNGRCWVC